MISSRDQYEEEKKNNDDCEPGYICANNDNIISIRNSNIDHFETEAHDYKKRFSQLDPIMTQNNFKQRYSKQENMQAQT